VKKKKTSCFCGGGGPDGTEGDASTLKCRVEKENTPNLGKKEEVIMQGKRGREGKT